MWVCFSPEWRYYGPFGFSGGAVPATIAILSGVIHVGLAEDQLEHIARKGSAVVKVSRRDLAAVVAQEKDGATTVSATMLIAARVGISVFVTGGDTSSVVQP